MNTVHIGFYRNKSILSRLIALQTRSPYSHVCIEIPVGASYMYRYEAVLGEGVIKQASTISMAEDLRDKIDWRTMRVTDGELKDMTEFADAQVGKKYDLSSVIRFVSRNQIKRESAEKWFCSELVFAILCKAESRVLVGVEPWQVSPGMLSTSPLLK